MIDLLPYGVLLRALGLSAHGLSSHQLQTTVPLLYHVGQTQREPSKIKETGKALTLILPSRAAPN